jgi:predicted site-specific integrase-resolvase
MAQTSTSELKQSVFNRKQVAEIFGIQPRTIIKWEKSGLIKPTFYIYNKPRYSIEEIKKVATKTPRTKSDIDGQ